MKATKITYWVATGTLCAMMLFFAILYLTEAPKIMATFAHLGYPEYFPMILGVAKILGVIALLLPGMGLVKEWAYTGFGITFLAAFISHLAAGDGPKALPALLALGFLVVSYFTRPAEKTVIEFRPARPVERESSVLMGEPRPLHG